MTTALLTTKLYIPSLRHEVVSRPRLIEQLNAGMFCKLTLISAPAGFGKTTLLSEWISTLRPRNVENQWMGKNTKDKGSQSRIHNRVAWLSLDERDNDPERFWIYFIAALQTIAPELGATMLALLESHPVAPSFSMTSKPRWVEKETNHKQKAEIAKQPDQIEIALTALINEIAVNQQGDEYRPFILVLDDYHVIDSETIHAGVTFLLEHLPSVRGLHLVIAGRTDPPLPLSRLRSRRHLNELDEMDLRFTPDEASTFLNQVMGLGLSAQDVAELEARTEGWIVGLQMAAQSIMGRSSGVIDSMRPSATGQQLPTTTEFIRSFSGSHRDVVDYLTDEVLLQQPTEVQNFLLQTSILDRLCGSLCDAVCTLGIADSHGLETMGLSAQDKLEYLETANLFIVPLDSERKWFRFHHLFRELLRQRLNLRHPDLEPALHLRASSWYAKEDLIDQAVSHALMAGDYENAADLIQQHMDFAFSRGEFKLVKGWLESLPEELIRSRPLLCIAYAYSTEGEDLDRADRWVEEAQTSLATLSQHADLSSFDPDLYDTVIRYVAIYHVISARARGKPSEKVIELVQNAWDLVPDNDYSNRSLLTAQLGLEQLNSGDEDASERNFVEAVRIGKIGGSHYITLIATYLLTIIFRRRGRLREIAAMCRDTLASMTKLRKQSGRPFPITGLISIMLGSVLLEWNDLEGADHALNKGLEAAKLAPGLVEEIRWMGGLALARLKIAQGNFDGLSDLVDWITQSERWSKEQVETIRTHIYLLRSHREPQYLDYALRLIGERRLEPAKAEWDWEIWDKLIWARALIKQSRFALPDGRQPDLQSVLDFLDAQYRIVEEQGWVELMINILIVQALAFHAQSKEDQAHNRLERALTLAKPDGYIRIFIDEGPCMALLLYQAVQRGIMPEYAGKLLAAFEVTSKDKADRINQQPVIDLQDSLFTMHPVPVVETLTPRETEVLQLISEGLSNREIAQRLSISLSTVKRHNANIYDKLAVNNRTQAVARARYLGIL